MRKPRPMLPKIFYTLSLVFVLSFSYMVIYKMVIGSPTERQYTNKVIMPNLNILPLIPRNGGDEFGVTNIFSPLKKN
jgi:hypothetical protein